MQKKQLKITIQTIIIKYQRKKQKIKQILKQTIQIYKIIKMII